MFSSNTQPLYNTDRDIWNHDVGKYSTKVLSCVPSVPDDVFVTHTEQGNPVYNIRKMLNPPNGYCYLRLFSDSVQPELVYYIAKTLGPLPLLSRLKALIDKLSLAKVLIDSSFSSSCRILRYSNCYHVMSGSYSWHEIYSLNSLYFLTMDKPIGSEPNSPLLTKANSEFTAKLDKVNNSKYAEYFVNKLALEDIFKQVVAGEKLRDAREANFPYVYHNMVSHSTYTQPPPVPTDPNPIALALMGVFNIAVLFFLIISLVMNLQFPQFCYLYPATWFSKYFIFDDLYSYSTVTTVLPLTVFVNACLNLLAYNKHFPTLFFSVNVIYGALVTLISASCYPAIYRLFIFVVTTSVSHFLNKQAWRIWSQIALLIRYALLAAEIGNFVPIFCVIMTLGLHCVNIIYLGNFEATVIFIAFGVFLTYFRVARSLDKYCELQSRRFSTLTKTELILQGLVHDVFKYDNRKKYISSFTVPWYTIYDNLELKNPIRVKHDLYYFDFGIIPNSIKDGLEHVAARLLGHFYEYSESIMTVILLIFNNNFEFHENYDFLARRVRHFIFSNVHELTTFGVLMFFIRPVEALYETRRVHSPWFAYIAVFTWIIGYFIKFVFSNKEEISKVYRNFSVPPKKKDDYDFSDIELQAGVDLPSLLADFKKTVSNIPYAEHYVPITGFILDQSTDVYVIFRCLMSKQSKDVKVICATRLLYKIYLMLEEIDSQDIVNATLLALSSNPGEVISLHSLKTGDSIPSWLLSMNTTYDSVKKSFNEDTRRPLAALYTLCTIFLASKFFTVKSNSNNLRDFYHTLKDELASVHKLSVEKYVDISFNLFRRLLMFRYTGCWNYDKIVDLESDYSEIIHDFIRMDTGDLTKNSCVPVKIIQTLIDRAFKLVERLKNEIRSTNRDVEGSSLRLKYTRYVTELELYLGKARVRIENSTRKMPPATVTLFGGPGVGKSTATQNVMSLLNLIYNDVTDQRVELSIAKVQDRDAYDSAVYNETNAILMDDAMLCISSPEIQNICLDKLFRFNCSTKALALKADVSEKASTWINNHILVITTNLADLKAPDLVAQPDSVYRRMGLKLELRVKPEYCIPGSLKADPGCYDKCPKTALPSHMEYRIFDFETTPLSPNKMAKIIIKNSANSPEGWMDATEAAEVMMIYAREHYVRNRKLLQDEGEDILCPCCKQLKTVDFNMCCCDINETLPSTQSIFASFVGCTASELFCQYVRMYFWSKTAEKIANVLDIYKQVIYYSMFGCLISLAFCKVAFPYGVYVITVLMLLVMEAVIYVNRSYILTINDVYSRFKNSLFLGFSSHRRVFLVLGFILLSSHISRIIKNLVTRSVTGVLQSSVEEKLAKLAENRLIWSDMVITKPVCKDEKVLSTDVDQMTEKISQIVCHVALYQNDRQVSQNYGLVMNEHFISTVAHMFGPETNYDEKYKLCITLNGHTYWRDLLPDQIYKIPSKDLVYLNVDIIPKLTYRGIDFLADKDFQGETSMRWIRPDTNQSDLIFKDVHGVRHNIVPPYVSEGYKDMVYKPVVYKVLDDSGFVGLCGTPCFSKMSPRCLISMHTYGGSNFLAGVPISKSDWQYVNTKTILIEPNKFEGINLTPITPQSVDINCVSDIHPKNPVFHMALPLQVLGSIPSKYSNKAKIKAYPVADIIREAFKTDKDYSVGPDARETWVYRDFMHLTSHSKGVPESLVKYAIDDYCKPIASLISEWEDVKHLMKPLTILEAINGIPKLNVPPINFKASAGFGAGCKKKELVEGLPGDRIPTPALVLAVEAYLEKMKKSVSPGCITNATLKLEPMALKDGVKKKSRVFGVPEFAESLVQKMYYAPIIAFFTVHRDEFENALGINALSSDWEKSFESLFDAQPSPEITDRAWVADYTKYDCCHQSMIKSAGCVVCTNVAKHFFSDDDIFVLNRIGSETFFPIMACKDALICPESHMASGVYMTSLFNSLYSSLNIRSAFYKHYSPEVCFRSHHKIKVLGDDLMVRDTHLCDPAIFNPAVFANDVAEFDYKVVNPSDKSLPPDYCLLKDAEFLSRKTVWCPYRQCIIGTLKQDSIFRMLSAYNPTGSVDMLERYRGACLSALYEATGYSEESYKIIQYMIIWSWQSMGIPLNKNVAESKKQKCQDSIYETPKNRYHYPHANETLEIDFLPHNLILNMFETAYPEIEFMPFDSPDSLEFYTSDLDVNSWELQTESAGGANDLAESTVLVNAISEMVVPEPTTLVIDSGDYFMPGKDSSVDLNTIPGRRAKILDTTMSLGSLDNITFDPYVTYMANTDFYKRVAGHAYVRFNIKLYITFSVSGDHYGAVSVCYYPLSNRIAAQVDNNNVLDTMWDSTMNCIIVDLTKNSTVEYNVPFIWPHSMFALPVSPANNLIQPGTFGTIQLRSLVPLRSTSATHVNSINVEVFAEAEDLMLGGPSALMNLQTNTFPNEKPSVMLKQASAIAGAAANLFKGSVAYLPSKIASITLGGASQIAASLGYSKPRQLEFTEYLTTGNVGSMSSTSGVSNARLLGPERTHETNINPSLTGLISEDKLIIENLGRTKAIIGLYSFNSETVPGLLMSLPVTCAFFLENNGSIGLPPASAAALFFSFWTGGTICYRLTVIKHPTHGGTLTVTHDPVSYVSSANPRINKTHRVDLRTESVIDIRVKWASNRPALLVRQGLGVPNDSSSCNGFLNVFLDSNLYSTGTAVAEVKIIVEYWWEDVILYGPTMEFYDNYKLGYDWSTEPAATIAPYATYGDPYYGGSDIGNTLPIVSPGIADPTTVTAVAIKTYSYVPGGVYKPPSGPVITKNPPTISTAKVPAAAKKLASSIKSGPTGFVVLASNTPAAGPDWSMAVAFSSWQVSGIDYFAQQGNSMNRLTENTSYIVDTIITLIDGVWIASYGPSEFGEVLLIDLNDKILGSLGINPLTSTNATTMLNTGISVRIQPTGTGFYRQKFKIKGTKGVNAFPLSGFMWNKPAKNYRLTTVTAISALATTSWTCNKTPVAMAMWLNRTNLTQESHSYHRIENGILVYKFVPLPGLDSGQPPISIVASGNFTYKNGTENLVTVTLPGAPSKIIIIPNGDVVFTGNMNVFHLGMPIVNGVQSEFNVSGNPMNVTHIVDSMAGERVLSLRSLMKLPCDPIQATLNTNETYVVSAYPRRGTKNANAYNLMTMAHLGVSGSVCFLIEICSNNCILVARRNPSGGITSLNFEICKPVGSKMFLFEVPFYAREKFYVPRGANTPDNTLYWGSQNDFMNVGLHPIGLQITVYDPAGIYDPNCILKIWTYAGESFNLAGFLHIPVLAPKSTTQVVSVL